MIQRRIVALFLTLFLAIPAVLSATAQTPAASDFPPDAGELTGMQAAVYRDYVTVGTCISGEEGCSSFMDATPMTEEDIKGSVRSFTVFVYELDSADNATVAYEQLSEGLLGSLSILNQSDGSDEITSENLDGIGSQATLGRLVITSTFGATTRETTFEYLTFQRDEYVIVVSARRSRGPSEEPLPELDSRSGPIIALATDIAANGEPSAGDMVYAEDGTSTGGLWSFMPAADHPLLMGLIPFGDFVMYPEPER